MVNFIRFDKTTDIGVVRRGKYTLPKMDAFAKNVLDVLRKQSEK
jgi:hypothetical protein